MIWSISFKIKLDILQRLHLHNCDFVREMYNSQTIVTFNSFI